MPAEESFIGSTSELAEQLVVEITVSNLDRSLALYTALGFALERREGDFAALRWGERRLFLDQRSDLPAMRGCAELLLDRSRFISGVRWTYNDMIRRHKCPIGALFLFPPQCLPAAY